MNQFVIKTQISVKKKNKFDLDLVFPDAPDFISEPPKYTVAEMIKLSEAMLPYWNIKRYEPGSPYLKPVVMDEFKIIE